MPITVRRGCMETGGAWRRAVPLASGTTTYNHAIREGDQWRDLGSIRGQESHTSSQSTTEPEIHASHRHHKPYLQQVGKQTLVSTETTTNKQ
jgi:hypothetical protein